MSESTQWAVLTPVILLIVLGIVQMGVWLYSRTVASQAAATAADLSASGAPGALTAGERVATSGGLQQVSITTATRGDLVVVTVSGRAPVFFDVGQGQITEQAVLPLESRR
jgi:Flp pilus assembly protein TadG